MRSLTAGSGCSACTSRRTRSTSSVPDDCASSPVKANARPRSASSGPERCSASSASSPARRAPHPCKRVRDSVVVVLEAERFSSSSPRTRPSPRRLRASSRASCSEAAACFRPRRRQPCTRSSARARASWNPSCGASRPRLEHSGPPRRCAHPTSAPTLCSLAQTEAKSRYVLLLVDDEDEAPWRAFALRQSDRVLVFTDGRGSPSAFAETVRGAELAFVGNPASAAIAGGSTRSSRAPTTSCPTVTPMPSRGSREAPG